MHGNTHTLTHMVTHGHISTIVIAKHSRRESETGRHKHREGVRDRDGPAGINTKEKGRLWERDRERMDERGSVREGEREAEGH